jgi:hypothetical protein
MTILQENNRSILSNNGIDKGQISCNLSELAQNFPGNDDDT